MKTLRPFALCLAGLVGSVARAQDLPPDPVMRAREQRSAEPSRHDLPPVPRGIVEPPPLPPPELHAHDIRKARRPAARPGTSSQAKRPGTKGTQSRGGQTAAKPAAKPGPKPGASGTQNKGGQTASKPATSAQNKNAPPKAAPRPQSGLQTAKKPGTATAQNKGGQQVAKKTGASSKPPSKPATSGAQAKK